MEKSLIILQVLIAFVGGYFLLRSTLKTKEKPSLRSVAILVLGDIGRSPRMMYHAESFAQSGFRTYLIGNRGTKPIPSLLTLPRVQIIYLSDPPKTRPNTPFILSAPRKVFIQVFSILDALLVQIPHPPEFILVQNPPSIPTLALVWVVSWIRGSKVIIDWHNLGYSILALKLGQTHPFVQVAKWFESYFGRSAYAHLFVTQAMRDYLVEEWNLQGIKVVLHDRPPSHFHRASASEMHELFVRLTHEMDTPSLKAYLPQSSSPYSTPFTSVPRTGAVGDGDFDSPMASLRADRPALLLSSTSWTPDEDFSILLEALSLYDEAARKAAGKLPKVLMIVTGKGPDKIKYMKQVDQLHKGTEGKKGWEYVRCVSMWLEAADYPLLLGSADIGISLHSSSSALDLPMKIVDMFGCGLPVCALNFACLDELVKDGVNGLVFGNAEQLAKQLETLLAGFPSSATLDSLRASLLRTTPIESSLSSPPPSASSRSKENTKVDDWEWCSWTQNWNKVMRPLLLSDVHPSGQ